MDRTKKIVIAVVGAVLVIGIGAGVVLANSSDDTPLTGERYDRATEAALDHVGGGEVIETEVGDDGAAYGVEIRKGDGSVVEVNLDENYEVIGSEPDDDGAEGEDDDAGEAGEDD